MIKHRVRLFCDWDNDSRQLIERLKDQSFGFYGDQYRNLLFVDDDSYDVPISFNYPRPEITYHGTGGLVLLLEPPEIYPIRPVDPFWDMYSFADAPPLKPAFGLGYATAPLLEYPLKYERERKACMIVSNKRFTPYHFRRHEIKDALLASDLDIHFYGRGLSGTDHRIHGEIPGMQKHKIIQHYTYVIDFENSPLNVVTDKFFDPIICDSVPITNSRYAYSELPNSCGFVDFSWPLDRIVSTIAELIEKDPDHDLRAARDKFVRGSWSLANWIAERVNNG